MGGEAGRGFERLRRRFAQIVFNAEVRAESVRGGDERVRETESGRGETEGNARLCEREKEKRCGGGSGGGGDDEKDVERRYSCRE